MSSAEGNGRGGLLSAGGILSIIIGAFELVGGGILTAALLLGLPLWRPDIPFYPGLGEGLLGGAHLTIVLVVGIVLIVLGIVAVVGGISAMKRSSFGLALFGAICALLPLNIPGLLAVIFVALGRGEFGAGPEY